MGVCQRRTVFPFTVAFERNREVFGLWMFPALLIGVTLASGIDANEGSGDEDDNLSDSHIYYGRMPSRVNSVIESSRELDSVML
ncbi:hypothetical protein HYALB_00006548 [Hymenoscyphus albidus]|uniref:Uncharacterized protein n=1 Tax=Hymenoscyphus albidus TaxID=595503 RepID=A0A9N9QBV2_9HELO|nr:hypothetical protein HYALB_00006548 [Hymenoscyphus albidus]